MDTTEYTRLGALLIEGNLVREEELERCLELQSLTGGSRPLGQILIEQDVITRQDLKDVLDLQQRRLDGNNQPIDGVESGVENYMVRAVEAGATDLILSEGKSTMLRINGELRVLDHRPLHSPGMWQFLLDYMGTDVLDKLADQQYVSREFCHEGIGRGRINAFRHFDGACAVVRIHPEEVRLPEESGIDETVTRAVRSRKGLVLLTGQMGSGITSTIATLLKEIVRGEPKLVIVLDETREYDLDPGNADIVFRRVGRDTRDYETGLGAAIRENPDVLVVADVSSPRSFDLALRAAEGGCLVIGALNAKDIQSALLRVLNFYPSYDVQRIRNSLAAVLSCMMRLQLVPGKDGGNQTLATELLLLDGAAQTLLREGQLSRLAIQMVMEHSGKGYTMDTCLEKLFAKGRIGLEDGFRYADDKTRFLKRTRGLETTGE